MKTIENNSSSSSLTAYAVTLAKTHAEGCEKNCRCWRMWSVVRRCLIAVLLLTATVITVKKASDLFHQPSTEGTLAIDIAMANVHQTLLSI